MDYITARERELMQYLLSQKGMVPISEAARELNVSARTIHRDLEGLEKRIEPYHLTLRRQTGRGIEVIGEESSRNELLALLRHSAFSDYTPEERKTLLLSALLEANEPVKLTSLAVELNVTAATVSHDLDKAEEWLSFFDLQLIRRRGYGVEVVGTEKSRRRAMSSLMVETFGENEFFHLMRETMKQKPSPAGSDISNRLLGMVEKERWALVEGVLHDFKSELPYSFADSAYIGLAVHLTLAMERIIKGENIEINESYFQSLQETKEFAVAEQLISRLEQVFQRTIPKAEIGYITMHLRGAKLRNDQEYTIDLDSLPSAVQAKSLIQFVEERVGKNLTGDESLFQGLVAHLEPTLYRIKERMKIHNPLLKDIKSDYPELFSLIKEAASDTFSRFELPDAEIGFLVLHFGSAIERANTMEPLHALVVCSSGIGSSKMLVTRLQKEIPELQKLKNISLMDLENESKREGYDVIISTLSLPDSELPHIVVNPFLTDKDIRSVQAFIREQHKDSLLKKRRPISSGTSAAEEPIEKLVQMQAYTNTILMLLGGLEVEEVTERGELSRQLEAVCQRAVENGVIQNAEAVRDKLLERYAMGGVAIPNSGLALFHARSVHVTRPSFTVWDLPEPKDIQAMDGSVESTYRILLLLAPEYGETEIYEVLSAVSEQLIGSRESLIRFRSADKKRLTRHMGAAFHEWLKEKLQ
ncbi:mannitol operon transcriptional antiterminator [Sinobaca qinghaiensis]|uniref:Mannitol operon transcriptional antiterminator n=1 Tax=Sinobaca qinghaiensis TaxID=342944 RepID=A0A419V441_9BACL|nr:BglG family transcription antiterminator [Sinobaca qinghaiensis]RKD73260.1 mannitol operon transcriptional antiterminator [Sinobaca qinghaiensis]